MRRIGERERLLSAENLLFILIFLLGIWGLLNILSARSASDSVLALAGRQLVSFIIGMAVMTVAARIPFAFYRNRCWLLALLFFLSLVLLPLLGTRINGMCGWFRFGSFSLQPSEPAKAIFLLTLVACLTRFRGENMRFLLAALAASLWMLPILFQPDFGTAAIYLGGFLMVIFLGGAALWKLALLAIGGLGIAGAFLLRNPYAWKRLEVLFAADSDPLGSGWHFRQFELTVARGGFWGEKLGGAVWSNAYLPLAYNDSAYAAMSETLGFIGVLPVYAGFLFAVYLLLRIAARPELAADARLYILAAAALLAVQTLVHVSVNLMLLPPTGLTFPLISYGGSSLVGCCFLLGIAISAGRERKF